MTTAMQKEAAPAECVSNVSEIVDELGQIQAEIRQLFPAETKARLKILGKLEEDVITRLIEAQKPPLDTEIIVEGSRYRAVIGAAANERMITIGMAKLARLVDRHAGKGTFLENCGFTLKACEKTLPAPILESIIKTERTGRRIIETAAKSTE